MSSECLAQAARQWNGPIRAGLERLAQAAWPDARLLGLFPVHRYRLRHRSTAATQVWWVEHDIPPYDRYECAAYRVELVLNGQNEPRLTVFSDSAPHPVKPLNRAGLAAALASAAAELPLTISRQMGPAFD